MRGQARRSSSRPWTACSTDHHGVLAAAAAGPDRVPGRADHRSWRLARSPRWPQRCPSPGAWTPTGRPARPPAPARTPPVLAAAAPAGRDPRRQRGLALRDHRRDRPGHGPLPHPGPPGVLGRAVPVRPPVRPPARQGQAKDRATATPRGAAGQAAIGAARTDTFLGERLRAGSPAAAARPRPRSPSPAPSWSSSGTCSPTPPPATATSARTTTPAGSTGTRRSAPTSAACRPSA